MSPALFPFQARRCHQLPLPSSHHLQMCSRKDTALPHQKEMKAVRNTNVVFKWLWALPTLAPFPLVPSAPKPVFTCQNHSYSTSTGPTYSSLASTCLPLASPPSPLAGPTPVPLPCVILLLAWGRVDNLNAELLQALLAPLPPPFPALHISIYIDDIL